MRWITSSGVAAITVVSNLVTMYLNRFLPIFPMLIDLLFRAWFLALRLPAKNIYWPEFRMLSKAAVRCRVSGLKYTVTRMSSSSLVLT